MLFAKTNSIENFRIYRTSPISDCNDPVIPVFGHMLLTHNQSEAIFSCQNGYTLKGSRVLYCNMDGSGWSSISPTCGKSLVFFLIVQLSFFSLIVLHTFMNKSL